MPVFLIVTAAYITSYRQYSYSFNKYFKLLLRSMA